MKSKQTHMINLKQHYSSFNRKKANTKKFEKREQNEKSVDDKLVFKPKDFLYKVIDCLVEENIVPTPDTIRAYFEKMLEDEDETTQNNFAKYYQRKRDYQDISYLYQELYKLLKLLQEVVSITTTTNKNIEDVKDIGTAFDNLNLDSLDNVSLNMYLQNYLEKIKIISKKFQRQHERLIKRHQSISATYNTLQGKIKFNSMIAGTYRKDYFLKELEAKFIKINEFNYKATVLAIKAAPYAISNNITLLKIISEIIIKNIRNNDMVCYFENDVFLVLLKHSDLQESQAIILKLKIIFENLQIIVNEKSIKFRTKIEAMEVEKGDMKVDAFLGSLLQKID